MHIQAEQQSVGARRPFQPQGVIEHSFKDERIHTRANIVSHQCECSKNPIETIINQVVNSVVNKIVTAIDRLLSKVEGLKRRQTAQVDTKQTAQSPKTEKKESVWTNLWNKAKESAVDYAGGFLKSDKVQNWLGGLANKATSWLGGLASKAGSWFGKLF